MANPQFSVGNFEDDVFTVLIAWITAMTGVKTIRAYENTQRPQEQYITVHVAVSQELEKIRKYCDSDNDDVFEVITSLERLPVDIKVYRDSAEFSAFDLGRAIKRRAYLEGSDSPLKKNCMSVESFGDVTNFREMIKQDFECQAFLRAYLLIETNDFVRLPSIGSVETINCDGSESAIYDDKPINRGC